jgi:hypothetical protein
MVFHIYLRSSALPEKLLIVQPFRKFRSILRSPKVHRRVHRRPPLVPILSQFEPVHTIPSYLRYILIFSTHLRLGLSSGLFHSGFPTNNLYSFLVSPIRATCLAHLILLDWIILIMFVWNYRNLNWFLKIPEDYKDKSLERKVYKINQPWLEVTLFVIHTDLYFSSPFSIIYSHHAQSWISQPQFILAIPLSFIIFNYIQDLGNRRPKITHIFWYTRYVTING